MVSKGNILENDEKNLWDDIKTFDDIPSPEEKKIIKDLEAQGGKKCPYLKKEGNFWYFCGAKTPEKIDKMPSPSNPVYQKHIGVAELQIWCLSSYENCCDFKNG